MRIAVQVPVDRITENPWQTRQSYSQEHIDQLAADIQRNGLLTPLIGRLVNAEGKDQYEPGQNVTGEISLLGLLDLDTSLSVQLACGHNRLRACKQLGHESVPVFVSGLTDEEMARVAWSENEARLDLNPADEAAAIARMIESFGWTQEQAAEHLGMGRSTLANKLRILRLPTEVLENVRSGKLSERQAIALVPAFEIPKADLKLLPEYYPEYKPENILKRALDGETSERIRERVENTKKQIESQRESEKNWKEQARERKQKEKERKEAIARGEVVELPSVRDLRDCIVVGGYYKEPDGCTEDCPCRSRARGYDGEEVQVCTNRERWQQLKDATETRQKAERGQLAAECKKAFHARFLSDAGPAWSPAAVRFLFSKLVRMRDDAGHLAAVAEQIGLPEVFRAKKNWTSKQAPAVDALLTLSMDQMLVYALACHVLRDLDWLAGEHYYGGEPYRKEAYDQVMAGEPYESTKSVDSVNQFPEPEDIADVAISGDGQACDTDVVAIADSAGVYVQTGDAASPTDADTQRAIEERVAGRHTFSQAEIEAAAEPEEEDLQPSEVANLVKRHKDATCWRIIRHKTKLLPSYIEQELATLKELLQDVEAARQKAPGNRQLLDLIVDIQLAQTELLDALKGKGALKA